MPSCECDVVSCPSAVGQSGAPGGNAHGRPNCGRRFCEDFVQRTQRARLACPREGPIFGPAQSEAQILQVPISAHLFLLEQHCSVSSRCDPRHSPPSGQAGGRNRAPPTPTQRAGPTPQRHVSASAAATEAKPGWIHSPQALPRPCLAGDTQPRNGRAPPAHTPRATSSSCSCPPQIYNCLPHRSQNPTPG
jgi:hypothetical protein